MPLINCLDGEIVFLRTGGIIVPCATNDYHKEEVVVKTLNRQDCIDGEKVYNNFMQRIQSTRHSSLNPIVAEEWIKEAIRNGIDITFDDYCLHYDAQDRHPTGNTYNMTKRQFDSWYDKLVVELANEALTTV